MCVGVAAAWLTVGGVAAASCVGPERIARDAVADFDAHVVQMRRRGAILAVDRVRRGPVEAGDRVEVIDADPGTSVGQVFGLGERYRLLPQIERRPYLVNACLAQRLPGRAAVEVPPPAPAEEDRLAWFGLVALLVASSTAFWRFSRRR